MFDAKPRQNTLPELKLAGIRRLDFDDFFALFGRGRHAEFESLYHELLRAKLSPSARVYRDRTPTGFATPPVRASTATGSAGSSPAHSADFSACSLGSAPACLR